MKFQSKAFRDYGVRLFKEVKSLFSSRRTELGSDAQAIYGSLGWNEIIIFLFSSDLAVVLKDVIAIGNLKLSDLGLGIEQSVFIDTFTVPCVEYAHLRDLLKTEEKSPVKANSSNLNTYLHIACKTGPSSYSVADKICYYFNATPEPVYGKTDFLVRPKLSFESFVARLLMFRKDNDVNKYVFATSSFFALEEMPIPKPAGEIQEPETNYKEIQIGDRLKALSLSDESLRMSLEDCYTGLNACLNNDVLSEVFMDLVPFAMYLLEHGESEFDRPYQRAELFNVVEAFAKAFRQRFLGSHLTLFEITELVLTYQGGVNRILQAANLIPYALLKEFNENWNGFTVFGLRGQYMRYSFGIINLPYECLFDPTRWFGILHEIGHDFLHKKNVLQKEEIISFLKSRGIKSLEDPDKLTEEQVEELRTVEEMLADLFDFIWGFRGDWQLYRDNVLAYVFSNWPERSLAYARRAFAIYLYHRNKGKTDLLANAKASYYEEIVRKLWDELMSCDEIKASLEKQEMLVLNPELVRQVVGYYFPMGKLIQWSVDFILKSRTGLPQFGTGDAESCLKAFEQGIVLDNVQDPVGLLLSLLRNKNKELRAVFSLIMSYSISYSRTALPAERPKFVLTRRSD